MLTNGLNGLNGFNTNYFPFPTETSPLTLPQPALPFIAFNYLGQLTVDGQNIALWDEYIPLAKGSVIDVADIVAKTFQFIPPDVTEMPPGNSTNTYNIIHIDRLTGRAVAEYRKMQ
jgi:hypothetical protein